MECIKCGRGLKLHRSRTNSKREVWGCPAAGCDYREDFPLWGPMVTTKDSDPVHQVCTDRSGWQRRDGKPGTRDIEEEAA